MTIGLPWVAHDAWSEMYLACIKQCTQLDSSDSTSRSANSALAQLVVVGSHHLVEFAVFGLLRPYIGKLVYEGKTLSEKRFEKLSCSDAMQKWTPLAVGAPLPFHLEPFTSAETLRKHRNAVVHKSSALTRVSWTGPALFTAVETTKSLYSVFGVRFPYTFVLQKNTLHSKLYFSAAVAAEPI
jgi:hypothetical protein